MSGGSFNHLYLQRETHNFIEDVDYDLMARSFLEFGADDVYAAMLAFKDYVNEEVDLYEDLWKAMERYRSNDCGDEEVQEALAEWRNGIQ